MRLQRRPYLLLTLILPLPIFAQVSMSQIQAIISFPRPCVSAYSTPLPSCRANMFRGIGGSESCSQECFDELTALTGTVQEACAGAQAGQDTVIGHFFVGDAAGWLCGFETGGVTTTAGAAAGTATQESSTAQESTATPESTAAPESSASTSSSSSSSRSSSKTTSQETSTTLETSSISTQTSSSTSSSSSSSSSRSTAAASTATSENQQIGITGGGSPFDIRPPASAASIRISLSLVLGVVLGAIMMIR